MKNQTYEIRTIKELADLATFENLAVLTHDLSLFLQYAATLKRYGGTIPGLEVEMQNDVFTWCDDGLKGASKIVIHLKAEGNLDNERNDNPQTESGPKA